MSRASRNKIDADVPLPEDAPQAEERGAVVDEFQDIADATVPQAEGGTKILVDADAIEKLLAEFAQVKAELAEVKKQTARHVTDEFDLTDELLFLARPNGNQWSERVVIDNKTTVVDFTGTAFYGPFDNLEQINTYLDEKGRKRPDSAIDWQSVKTMSGAEARKILAFERNERLRQFGGLTAVNILDRRMRPVVDAMTGSLDRQPGIGIAIPVKS